GPRGGSRDLTKPISGTPRGVTSQDVRWARSAHVWHAAGGNVAGCKASIAQRPRHPPSLLHSGVLQVAPGSTAESAPPSLAESACDVTAVGSSVVSSLSSPAVSTQAGMTIAARRTVSQGNTLRNARGREVFMPGGHRAAVVPRGDEPDLLAPREQRRGARWLARAGAARSSRSIRPPPS